MTVFGAMRRGIGLVLDLAGYLGDPFFGRCGG